MGCFPPFLPKLPPLPLPLSFSTARDWVTWHFLIFQKITDENDVMTDAWAQWRHQSENLPSSQVLCVCKLERYGRVKDEQKEKKKTPFWDLLRHPVPPGANPAPSLQPHEPHPPTHPTPCRTGPVRGTRSAWSRSDPDPRCAVSRS